MYKIQKFRSDKNKEYYFRIVASNGKIVCSSEGYKNKRDRDHIADNLTIMLMKKVMEDFKDGYGFSNINSPHLSFYTEEAFEKEMNNLGYIKFPMYKIYCNFPETGKETFHLNKRTGESGLFNLIEKESLIAFKKLHKMPKTIRIEEINPEDLKEK